MWTRRIPFALVLVLAGCSMALPGQLVVVAVNRDAVDYRAVVWVGAGPRATLVIPALSSVIVFRGPINEPVQFEWRTATCDGLGTMGFGTGATDTASQTEAVTIFGGSFTLDPAEVPGGLIGAAAVAPVACPSG